MGDIAMRMLGRRFLNRSMQAESERRIESRAAVVYSIDSTARTCLVKIQNSTDSILTYYPEGWTRTPFWLKKNAPVQICHKGGHRGRLEILGLGQVIPTQITGGEVTAVADTPDDAIMSGCEVTQIPNDPEMAVMVQTGYVRIDGSTYEVGPVRMSSSTSCRFRMGMGGHMGLVAGVSTIAAAPGGGYRQDKIVIGEDIVIDVVAGTTFSTAEVLPDTPASHVEAGRVLISSSMTSIVDSNINQVFVAPQPTEITVTVSTDQLSSVESTASITVTIIDQYGNESLRDSGGWYVTLEFSAGNGIISAGGIESTEMRGQYTGSTNNQAVFGYKMDTSTTPSSPVFLATLHSNYAINGIDSLILKNSSGEIYS